MSSAIILRESAILICAGSARPVSLHCLQHRLDAPTSPLCYSDLPLLFSRLRAKETTWPKLGCTAWRWRLGCDLTVASQLRFLPGPAFLLAQPPSSSLAQKRVQLVHKWCSTALSGRRGGNAASSISPTESLPTQGHQLPPSRKRWCCGDDASGSRWPKRFFRIAP